MMKILQYVVHVYELYVEFFGVLDILKLGIFACAISEKKKKQTSGYTAKGSYAHAELKKSFILL